ncbi:MAG: hypothetical protein JWO19_2866 [Bryobacterales bacterium]|jgi:hypothetical protein|nr:hypothetical protein [Bryobacterales bacterium]
MSRPATCAVAAVLLAASWAIAQQLEDTFFIPLDDPAIQYGQQPANDPVARLQQRMESGKAKLEVASGLGYLPSVLKQLGINPDSQGLVFSKTSAQSEKIGPRTPRAVYFNDDVTIGFVRDSDVLEIAALDPKQGIQFYVLVDAPEPAFARSDGCLRCHQGAVTLGIPGLLISSIHPASQARSEHGNAFMTDHRTPLSGRWGGWYVTGTHGSQTHLGNNTNLVDPVRSGGPSRQPTQNLTSLAEMFDTSRYLAPTSDIVALMTLEHQTRMTNLMIRIGWDARIGVAPDRLNTEIEEMLKYMLFADEEPLREPVKGVSTFTDTFPQRGPRDPQGRSLRDFDLKTRLFRYPLSYMIYSAAFDGLPDKVRDRVYGRLYEILSGKDTGKTFAHLSPEVRGAILEIVRATKPNLPDEWRL